MRRKTNLSALALCLPLAAIGIYLVTWARELVWTAYPAVADNSTRLAFVLGPGGERLDSLTDAVSWLVLGVGALLVLAAVLGLLFKSWLTLQLLRGACIGYYVALAAGGHLLVRGTGVVLDYQVKINGADPTRAMMCEWGWTAVWPYLLLGVVVVLVHLGLYRRRLINAYAHEDSAAPARGDLAFENLRTHGGDPRYRKSLLGSVGLHLLVLVVIPYLVGLIGCVRAYRVPLGSGGPMVMVVRMYKPKQKKKRMMMLDLKSAIVFHQPDIDDSRLLQDVDEETRVTHVATTAHAGKMGAGGGKEGGWPDGSDKAEFRFIRLKYNGSQWDDGMAEFQRSDRNFLEYFHTLTGFKVAKFPEAHPISQLKNYPKGYAPPFIFVTGNESINTTTGEEKILRDYLLDGGMLFADCGGANWDGAFRSLMQRVFPEKPLLDIPDDDPIFKMPYEFQNGAPPLWHHGGMRALGIKHNSRWCVFYHPGDIHEAWKTGNSGIKRDQADQAFQMGVNVVYYSVTNYLQLTRKYRKK